jgi:DNA-binding response OmpR family regulator
VRGSAYERRVELRVVDAGPGVPRGQSDRLFAPFHRLGDREPRGLGLGLGVARGFSEAVGGTFTAEDTPGGGLTMVVSLPAATQPAHRVRRRSHCRTRRRRDQRPDRRRRHPAPASAADHTARGYTVVTAADGRTALRAAAERKPDVVVLDLGLPDVDGGDVVTELRTFTQAPIIVLSTRTDSTDKVHALDRGADDYVTKPFGVEELAARLRAAARRATASGGTPGQDDEPIRAGDLELLHHIWGPPDLKETSYLRVYLAQLRHELERDPARPRHLITEAGWATGSTPDPARPLTR